MKFRTTFPVAIGDPDVLPVFEARHVRLDVNPPPQIHSLLSCWQKPTAGSFDKRRGRVLYTIFVLDLKIVKWEANEEYAATLTVESAHG